MDATIHDVHVGAKQYRVIKAAQPLEGTLLELGDGWFGEFEAAAIRTLAIAWAVAARSPHSAVFLPLATTAEPMENLDIVLVHHRLQMPPSKWTSIRRRLGKGKISRVSVPDSAYLPRSVSGGAYRRSALYHSDKDDLRWVVAGRTLVVVGSRLAFDDHVRQFAAAARGELDRPGGEEFCVEIGWHRLDLHLHLRPPNVDH
ncbi:hypothetical protein ACEXOS_019110 [Herbiconiux sp. P16]|uniref:hypothetical protein n=1 Tax=Herbiconiux wuyangfengii TaxID=3342794 RepID=UPI0035B9B07A